MVTEILLSPFQFFIYKHIGFQTVSNTAYKLTYMGNISN